MTTPEPRNPETERDTSFQTVLDCYLSLILDVAEALIAVSPEIGAAFQEQLIRVRTRLAFEPNVATLEASRNNVHLALEAFAEKTHHYNKAVADDLNRTLALVANGEEARSDRNIGYVAHLVDFVDQMEKALRSGDLPRLATQAVELRGFAESIELDSRDAFARLRQEIDDVRHRLREAELRASLDPLTEVANRREFDRQIEARIEAQREFCVLLFDLNEFKTVNDRFGHLWGDAVLKQVGARLSGQVRLRDFVCRWGGDEFVVILDCGLDPALARSRQISQWLTGPYRVAVEGREVLVDVGVSVGVAEYVAGETPDQLFRRVDGSMYRDKKTPALE
jgi:diguanylate cyclase (GGDEF)-like protein